MLILRPDWLPIVHLQSHAQQRQCICVNSGAHINRQEHCPL